MLRIGVLSDTHLQGFRDGGAVIERLASRYFGDAELILHAGDVVDPAVLLGLSGPSLYQVRGNLDPPQRGVPHRRVIEVGGFRIGLIHGWGALPSLIDRVLLEFKGERLDCLVFGHSHRPWCQRREGVLLFNPGSPTDRRDAPFQSVGLLELGDRIEGRIINIDTDSTGGE
jgi:putative phosphoesterase